MGVPMARKLRLEYPGAIYHVINRGNYRSWVFEREGAKKSFQKALFETCGRGLEVARIRDHGQPLPSRRRYSGAEPVGLAALQLGLLRAP